MNEKIKFGNDEADVKKWVKSVVIIIIYLKTLETFLWVCVSKKKHISSK